MRSARIAGFLLAALVALAPARALSQNELPQSPRVGTPGHTAEWNAEEVAKLASDLSTSVTEARRTAKRVPSPGLQSGQQTAWYHFNDQLRLIANEARHLASSVKDGRSHDEVYPIYQRMWTWIRDAQDTSKRMAIPQDLSQALEASGKILDQLDAYFD